jgi:cytochrome c-type biogenesis protein CcmH/NrfG
MPETSDRIAELRRELESNPASRQFYQLGELLRRAGRATEATSVLRAGLGHHPRYVAAWVSLGRACLDRGEPREAATALHEALELDAHNPVAWRLLGEARLAGGDRFGALDAMQHALQLAPGDEVLRAAVESLASETWPPQSAPRLEEAVSAGEMPAVRRAAAAVEMTIPPAVVVAVEPPAPLPEPFAEVLPAPPIPPAPSVPAAPPMPPLAVTGDLEDPFAVAPPSAALAALAADVFALPTDAATFADEPFGRAAAPTSTQPAFLADFFVPEAAAPPAGGPTPLAPVAVVTPAPIAEIEAAPALEEWAREPLAETVAPAVAAEMEPLGASAEAFPPPAGDVSATSAFAAAPLEAAVGPLVEVPAAEEAWVETPPPAFAAVEPAPMPTIVPTRPTLTLARLYLQQQDFPAAIAILERVVASNPENQEARDLLDLVHDMMAPLPGELPRLSARERKIAALQGWLASLTLGQERTVQ